MLENKRRSLSCVCFLTLVMFVSFKDNNVGDATCTTIYVKEKKITKKIGGRIIISNRLDFRSEWQTDKLTYKTKGTYVDQFW